MSDTKRGLEMLENWSRWAVGGEHAIIMAHYYNRKSAVCGDYKRRSDDPDADDTVVEVPIPVDEKEAVIVEDALKQLAPHLFKAVRYWYTGRPRIDRVSENVLRGWVEHAAREIVVIVRS